MKKAVSVFTALTLIMLFTLSAYAAAFSENWTEIKAYGLESGAEPENNTTVGSDGSFFTETTDASRWWPQNYYVYNKKVSLSGGIKSEIYARMDMALGSHYGISFSADKVSGGAPSDSYYPDFSKGFSIVLVPQSNGAAEIPVAIRTAGIGGVDANIATNITVSNDFASKTEIEVIENSALGYIVKINGTVAKDEDGNDLDLSAIKSALGGDVYLSYNVTFAGTSTGKYKLAKINGMGANDFVQTAASNPGNTPTSDSFWILFAGAFISAIFVGIIYKAKKHMHN